MEEQIANLDKAVEDAILKALKTHFAPPVETTNNPHVEFYNKFQRQADAHDSDFLKKYGGDLDITLIFAGLFSAVVAGFIAMVQTQIQPDYTQLSHDLLWMMAQSMNLNPPAKPSNDNPWNGPDPNLVRVQTILFSSLAVSLLAAFVAMLGKQWLNRYSQADMHGSLIHRGRDRQRKINGMTTWHFNLVMEFLPLMLQIALLLLGYALSDYLLTIDNLIAWVVAGFTASGLFFYTFIVLAGILSYDCPFQTPFSHFFHFVVDFDNKHRKFLKNSRRRLRHALSQLKNRQKPKSSRSPRLGGPGMPDGNIPRDHIELAMVGPHVNLPTLFEKETDWEGYVLDSNCIAWMFKMSVDEDVILEIMKFIPEIVWYNGIRTTPLQNLYDTVVDCFDHSSGSPVVTQKFRDKAYHAAKALVHLGIQRKCIGNESDTAAFNYIARRYQQNVGSTHYERDSDLEYTLGMIDRVFGVRDPAPMRWDKFAFTSSHHAWTAYILLYRTWSTLRNGENLPDDIKEFVLYSLRQVPAVAAPIISDCLSIVGLVLGIQMDADHQQVIDKSKKIQAQIHKIYVKLFETFEKTSPTATEVDRALEAMRLIAPLSTEDIANKSNSLFRYLMQAPVSTAYTQEKKWEASRLALHGAYKWDEVLPLVEDPKDILAFLSHHFELADSGEDQGEPIQNALRALAYALDPQTIDTFKNFDPTQPSFIRGICFAFQADRPRELRKAALFFLPLVADRWFNTSAPIMTTDEMKTLCEDWASAVDEIGHSAHLVQKVALAVLLDMMNSPHWRPHIVPKEWKLLERFTSAVPDDSEPLKRCLDNTELLGAISNMGNPDAMTLWSLVLWLRYNELRPEVQVQLKEVTKGVQKWDFERYLEAIEMEASKAENELTEYNTWSTDPEADVLRTKIDHLREAKESLMALQRGVRRR